MIRLKLRVQLGAVGQIRVFEVEELWPLANLLSPGCRRNGIVRFDRAPRLLECGRAKTWRSSRAMWIDSESPAKLSIILHSKEARLIDYRKRSRSGELTNLRTSHRRGWIARDVSTVKQRRGLPGGAGSTFRSGGGSPADTKSLVVRVLKGLVREAAPSASRVSTKLTAVDEPACRLRGNIRCRWRGAGHCRIPRGCSACTRVYQDHARIRTRQAAR